MDTRYPLGARIWIESIQREDGIKSWRVCQARLTECKRFALLQQNREGGKAHPHRDYGEEGKGVVKKGSRGEWVFRQETL